MFKLRFSSLSRLLIQKSSCFIYKDIMNYILQIPKAMWPVIIKFSSYKLLWMFLFVVIFTTAFLIIMNNGQLNELRKYILHGETPSDNISTTQICQSVHNKLQTLAEDLSEKENVLKQSRSDLRCAEKVLNFIEGNKIASVTRYKSLLCSLKVDLQKIEGEVRGLQDEIIDLSKQRESLKTDVLQQQENYEKIMSSFTKEIDTDSCPRKNLQQYNETNDSTLHSRMSVRLE